MVYSNTGIIADIMWHEIKNHTKNIELDAFVVMPNHVHGILMINNDDEIDGTAGIDGTVTPIVETLHDVQTLHATSLPKTTPIPRIVQTLHDVQTLHATSLPHATPPPPPDSNNEFLSKISPKSGSLSTIIRSYKSAVSKHAHRLGFDFAWQSRFHDHIIRNAESFERIRNYIINNPKNWKEDKFYF